MAENSSRGQVGAPVGFDDMQAASAGDHLRATAIPRDRWAVTLADQGMPLAFIKPYLAMEGGYNSGWIGFGAPGAERIGGTVTPTQVFAQARPGHRRS